MKKMADILANPYLDKNITIDRLYLFLTSLKNQMTLNNPSNVFNADIAALGHALAPIPALITARDAANTAQKAATSGVDLIIDNFEQAIDDNYYIILSIFPPSSATYLEFFPHGKNEYNNIKRSDAQMLMDRMLQATTDHAAELPAGVVTAFANFSADWAAARAAQLTDKDTTTNKDQDIQDVKITTADAGWQATGAIIKYYGNNLSAALAYFDESLLFPAHHSNDLHRGKVSASGTDNCIATGMTTASTFKLSNKGTTALRYYMAATQDGPAIGNHFDVTPGQSLQHTYTDFNANNNFFLNVLNLGAVEGKWEVKME